MKQAFTLIELLVVIAIIGVISTLGVVSFSSAREKARISNGLNFEGQILRSVGDDLVGRWDFDECVDTTSVDTGGGATNGTLLNGTAWSTDTSSGKGCSASFDGTDDSVEIPHKANQLTQNGMTISVWVKPNGLGEVGFGRIVDKSNDSGATGGYSLSIQSGPHVCLTVNASGSRCDTASVAFGKWTHIVVVSDATGDLTFYTDGKRTGTNTSLALSGITVSAPLTIGNRSGATDRTFDGLIDDVRIYGRVLSSREVEQMYAESASQHLASF